MYLYLKINNPVIKTIFYNNRKNKNKLMQK